MEQNLFVYLFIALLYHRMAVYAMHPACSFYYMLFSCWEQCAMDRKTAKNPTCFRHFCCVSERLRTSGLGPRHVNARSGKAARNCLRVRPSTSSAHSEQMRSDRKAGFSVSAACRLSGQTSEHVSHPQISGCCASWRICTSVSSALLCVSSDRHMAVSTCPSSSA